jgi:uncharacterized membrane protein YdjX (TVP38/TMEM64 family)
MVSNESPTAGSKRSAFRQWLPAALLLVVVVSLVVFGPDNAAIYQALRERREIILAFVADNAAAAAIIYFVVYVVVVAFSLPGGAMMTIIGGFLFGPVRTTVIVVFAATAGATMLFLVARSAVGNRLRARAGPWLRRMEAGFHENAMAYLLVLRLVPLFPFFVVNLVPAFLGISVRTYVIGTFVGIIPGTFVFALAGDGLGSVLDADGEFDASTVLKPEVIAALAGLALLAIAPVVYKKIRARRS